MPTFGAPDSAAHNRDAPGAEATLYLVRHGEVHNPDHVVYSDLPGFGLSERGRAQAEAAAERLAGASVARVLSSPLERALETARLIARPHGLTPEVDPQLTEWRMLHRWRGQTWESVEADRPHEFRGYLDAPLELAWADESLEALTSRVVAAIERAADAGPVVVVAHQDPIQAARLALTHRSLRLLNADKPRHAEIVHLVRERQWRELFRWAPDDADD